MGLIEFLIDFILHVDTNLVLLIHTYGVWVYILIFLVVFCETGLVVFPLLPGDSLIFIAGALSGQGSLNFELLFAVFVLAAVGGDAANYSIGHYLGPRVFHEENSRFFKKEYMDMAQEFYERHGGATIFLARFVPIVRTFAPFLAGIGRMSYRHFALYNILGGVAWVSLFLFGGLFFGGLQVVKDNLSLVIISIIVVTLAPTALKLLSMRKKNNR
jgi:membrane-associated protein